MATPLMKRFGHWLGTWRGTSELEDGTEGVIEVTLGPHFDGQLIEAEARSWQSVTGELRSHGIGLWALGRDGRVSNATWTDQLGFCVLDESPDDPEVLSLHGALAGSLTFSITLRFEDHSLLLSSRVGEGYAPQSSRPRTVARLHRTGMGSPEDGHE